MAESRTYVVSSGVYAPVTISTTAKSLTDCGATIAGCWKALITVETNSVRYTLDGTTTPTAANGHLVTAGSTITLNEPTEVANFKVIRASADAAIVITMYK